MSDGHVGETIAAKLAIHLGPNVSRMAIKSFAKKAGLNGPEQITATHIPAFIEEIRPMLKVMMGSGPTEALVTDISHLVR